MRQLNLFVNGLRVAVLKEEPAPLTGRPQYHLTYLPNTPPENYLSLSLPVSAESYVTQDMPFALRQNFPEGGRLLRLKKLGKVADVSDDFGILSITGHGGPGRVTASAAADMPASCIPDILLHDITRQGKVLFERLVREYGVTQGISGEQEKVLCDDTSISGSSVSHPIITGERFILKSFDPKRFPALAENEYWTMMAARNSGIETADVVLSDDGSTLIVKRFDVLENERKLALDEVGALAGFVNDQKYLASYEMVGDVIFQYVSDTAHEALAFFRQMVFMVAVKNGDAHMKNFALLSGDGRTRLAPAYDLVCTGAYVNLGAGEFENPAMPLDNERWEKHWWSRERLLVFGEQILGLSPEKMEPVFEQVAWGLQQTLRQMDHVAHSEDFIGRVLPQLSFLWSRPFDLEAWGQTNEKICGNKRFVCRI